MPAIDLKHILCPVDLSDQSRHAFEHALMLARWYGSRVTLLQVVWDAVPPVPFDPISPTMQVELFEEAKKELELFAKTPAASGVRVETAVLEGPVVSRILDEAKRNASGLIVMGTHGTTGFEHLVLGSMSEKVLRKATCPVLTVPPAVQTAPAAAAPFKTILCAVDFSKPSMRGLEYAFSLAKESGGRLILAHVIDWPVVRPIRGMPTLETAALRQQLAAEAGRELNAAIPADVKTWCQPETLVLTGKPFEELLKAAGDHHADVIVMGVHGRNAASIAFFGSTTNQIVRAATCPVLTVRS